MEVQDFWDFAGSNQIPEFLARGSVWVRLEAQLGEELRKFVALVRGESGASQDSALVKGAIPSRDDESVCN